jgi:hypothetical protein
LGRKIGKMRFLRNKVVFLWESGVFEEKLPKLELPGKSRIFEEKVEFLKEKVKFLKKKVGFSKKNYQNWSF